MENEKINKKDILNYTFYDDNKQLCVVLDEDYLKELFNADIVLLREVGHK